MITEFDLREAIAECEGTKNPSVSTCIKLAAFYTILEHLYGKGEKPNFENMYSYESKPKIRYSNSEFSKIVQEKGLDLCFETIDELMGTIYVINPSLYRNVIQKLTELN